MIVFQGHKKSGGDNNDSLLAVPSKKLDNTIKFCFKKIHHSEDLLLPDSVKEMKMKGQHPHVCPIITNSEENRLYLPFLWVAVI